MKYVQRSCRLTRRSAEIHQSSVLSERSRRSISTSEQISQTGIKRKHDSEDSAKKTMTKIQRKIVGSKKYDAFCWICHKMADEFYCPDCPRVYHHGCLKKIKHLKECICECKLTGIDGLKTQSSKSDIKELVLKVLYNVTKAKKNKKNNDTAKYSKHFKVWPDLPENELLCNIVDIQLIVDRIHNLGYKNTGQFYQDIKWIYHNSYIIKGSDNDMTQTAQKFDKAIKQQLADAEACGECYLEKCSEYPHIDFFTKVCTNPHSIVWAKLKGFPFWPAKCLRVVNGHADVRFFGTHDKSLVPFSQVYKISKENPSGTPKKPRNSTRMTSYEEAMAELSIYVTNYENKIGEFVYCQDKARLEAERTSDSKKEVNEPKKNACQMDVSVDAEDNGYNELSNSQENLHLDVSTLLDDQAETKVAVLDSTSICIEKFSDKGNDNLAESVMEPTVLCQMTFSTDEECPGEMQQTEEVIEATSESHSQLPEITGQFSVASIQDCSKICIDGPSTETLLNNTEPEQINSNSYINTNACTNSSSTSSPFLITSTQSLSKHFSDSAAEISKTNAEDNRLPSIPNITKMLEKLVPDNDDEILLLNETRSKTLTEGIIQNKPLTKTLCELLLSNKPNIRSYISSFQQLALRFYLIMWLEVNSGTLDANECKMFHAYYEKVCKAIEEYKFQIKTLQKENADLKEKLANQLSNEERKNAIKNEIVQAQCKKRIEEANSLRKEVKELSHNLVEARQNMNFIQELNKTLQSQKSDSECLLKQTQNELAECKKTINMLETKLISDKKTVKDVQCQAPTSDMEYTPSLPCDNLNQPSEVYDNLDQPINSNYEVQSSMNQGNETATLKTVIRLFQPGEFNAMVDGNLCVQPLSFSTPFNQQLPEIPQLPVQGIATYPSTIMPNTTVCYGQSESLSQNYEESYSESYESHSSHSSKSKSSKLVSRHSLNRSYTRSSSAVKVLKKNSSKVNIKKCK